MISAALLLSMSLLAAPAPVLVAVSTEGFADKDRAAVVARVVADVEGAGVAPMPLPPGVVTPACAQDPACARTLFAGGSAERLVVVDVLRAGSRASVAARVLDKSGATLAEQAGVVPMAKLLGGRDPLLSDDILAGLVAAPAAPTPTPTPTVTTTAPTTAPTTTAPTTTAPTTTAPTESAPAFDPTTMAIAGVSVAAVGALFLVGGSAAALGQNAVRLDASADGAARQNTAVTIPLALGVATLGAVGVGVGIVMLLGEGDAAEAPLPGAGG